MSIVLEALEKAQREGKKVSIDTVLDNIQKPIIEKKPISKSNYLIFGIVIAIGIINLILAGWWLDRATTLTPTNSSIPPVSTQKILPIISLKQTPPLNVTGIVWDEKEPIALVNGKFLKIGEEILGAKIMDIQMRHVRFLYKDKEFTISVE